MVKFSNEIYKLDKHTIIELDGVLFKNLEKKYIDDRQKKKTKQRKYFNLIFKWTSSVANNSTSSVNLNESDV